ncbi:MAG: YkvA family protein [Sorangiineae bacterium]|nr:YkvA family protein [Polyangiaceae bacterium]MEB2323612.1 YkvA family protein [Sorangiineae bacterium]
MGELEDRCLDAFPSWLHSLGGDARALADAIADPATEASVRRRAVGALNYLFKSLDLIPDGIEDLGLLDDAFVLRVAVAGLGESGGVVGRLARDAELIREFLEADYPRLEGYVAGLDQLTARGRSVADVVADAGSSASFAQEVRSWADAYAAPSFTRDEKTLVKLRSFLSAKLPG